MLGLVASNDYELEKLDVTTNFLNGVPEEEIFKQQLEGIIVPGKDDYIFKYNKTLYGLKQYIIQWYKRFDLFMIRQEFKMCILDHCVYYKNDEVG